LLNGIKEGVISYDKRKRDVALEEDPESAIFTLHEIVAKLTLFGKKGAIGLEIKGDTDFPELIDTTVERELLYVLEHAIHHMAILKIGFLFLSNEIHIPKHFGVAPSTIRYQDQCAQ
jgi:hypothetical protein